MKRVGRVLLAVSVCSSVLAGHLFGQSIPLRVKQAASIDQGSRQAIELAVAQHVKNLASQDAAVQRSAREAIVGELRTPTGEASAVFQAAYAEALGNAVMKLPKDASALSLLNAAISVARVAETTKSTKLEPVVLWLLGETQPEAIKLWGMKAARWIIPGVAKFPNNKLVAQILPTVKAHPSGAMTAEAYQALLVADAKVIDELLNVVELRASLYQGPEAPQDPNVDFDPFASFLSVDQWPSMTQPQKVRTMQLICQLIVLGARHGDAAEPGSLKQEQLKNLVQSMAKALEAIGLAMKNENLQNVAANVSRAAPPTMESVAKQICPAIKKVKGFEGVKEPDAGVEVEVPAEK